MRRITKIAIDNYRAYIQPVEISLPAGEDVLVYGENGSGKSSLYKALQHFLASSVDSSLAFETNRFSPNPDGSINITYTDFDDKGQLVAGSEQSYAVSTDTAQTTNDVLFIRTSHRASGFLDYSRLLRVYLNNGSRPNLYDLVIDLLGNYVPTTLGAKTISEWISSINTRLTTAYHRTDRKHQEALADFNRLQELFTLLIDQLNQVLRPMVSRYFPDMGMAIELVQAKMEIDDPYRIADMSVSGEVYIEVKHHGNVLPDYNVNLNEARLSAIATCLYLSSLKMIARTNDTRILFLDDVFIGLDLGNRRPVLSIVQNEFTEFQRIITTYDRSWFEMAKEVLSASRWRFLEMYEGETTDAAGRPVVRPLLTETDSSYGRACYHLNHKEHPDYPAAANYMRKVFEYLLQNGMYAHAVRTENYDIIPAHRLTNLVGACCGFVDQLHDYFVPQATTVALLSELKGFLHPLLHPLSHYVPDTPTYKAELKRVVCLYEELKQAFLASDYAGHCDVVWEEGMNFQFVVNGESGWEYKYTLRPSQNLYRYDNATGGQSLSHCKMRAARMEGKKTDGNVYRHQINNNDTLAKTMSYDSLQDCHDKIINHIRVKEGLTDIIAKPLDEMFIFYDVANQPQTLKQLLSNYAV